jgi:uncharacterized protein YoxC
LDGLRKTSAEKVKDLSDKVSQLDQGSQIFSERINFVKNLDWKPIEQRLHVLLGTAKAEDIIVRADEAFRGVKDMGPRVDRIEQKMTNVDLRITGLFESNDKTTKQITRIDDIQNTLAGEDGNKKLRQDLDSLRSMIKISGNCIRIGDMQVCSGSGKAIRQDGFPVQERMLRADFETAFKQPPVVTAVAVGVNSRPEEKVFFVDQMQTTNDYMLVRARQEDIKDLEGTVAEIHYLAIGKWR